MSIIKRKPWIIAIALVLIIAIVVIITKILEEDTNIVEVQDLYMDLTPYSDSGFGDEIVKENIYDSLVVITDKFEIKTGIASSYTESGNVITVKLGSTTINAPSGDIKVDAEFVMEYYESLTRLAEVDSISNPGIKNIEQITKVSDNELVFQFKSQKATNILALAEYIGYSEEGKWYGSLAKVEYDDTGIIVGDTKYVNANSLEMQADTRIANMIFSNAHKDDSLKKTKIPGNAYGFLTWGDGCTLGIESRKQIFNALENSKIRSNVDLSADSIFKDTTLYRETTPLKSTMHGYTGESLQVAVINLGSYTTIARAIEDAFLQIQLPVVVQTVELSDILSVNDYDIVYIRLERGKSPDFSSLLDENQFIGSKGYSDAYASDVNEIANALTWDDMCNKLGELDKRLREDGVWFFVDQSFNIETTRN